MIENTTPEEFYNGLTALELDDTAFIKLSEARNHIKKVEAAIEMIQYLKRAESENIKWIDFRNKHELLVEVTVKVTAPTAWSIVQNAQEEISLLLVDAQKHLETL